MLVVVVSSFLSCDDTVSSLGPEVTIQVNNLPNSLSADYEGWLMFVQPLIQKNDQYSNETTYVRLGKFRVANDGTLIRYRPFISRLEKEINLDHLHAALISIAHYDTGNKPGPCVIAGKFDPQSKEAYLTTSSDLALGGDFSKAKGYFLLDAPTATDQADVKKGLWFMKTVNPPTSGFENLPILKNGWKYMGYIDYFQPHLDLGGIETGSFVNPDSSDDDCAGYSKGDSGHGYSFPGSDFVKTNWSIFEKQYNVSIYIGRYRTFGTVTEFVQHYTLFGPTDIPPGLPWRLSMLLDYPRPFTPTARIKISR
jgi:hypothetical protein